MSKANGHPERIIDAIIDKRERVRIEGSASQTTGVPLTFLIKSIDSGYVRRLVISSQDEEIVGVFDLVG